MSCIVDAIRQERVGEVIRSFTTMFDIAIPDEPTEVPARSIIFLRGDEDGEEVETNPLDYVE